MARLVIIKGKTDKDLINLVNDAIEDDLKFEVDLQSNILFTTDLELIIKGSKNIQESISKETITAKSRWIPYYLDMMPVHDGSYRVDVRKLIRVSSVSFEHPLEPLQCLDMYHRSGRSFRINVTDMDHKIPITSLPVYLRDTSYKPTEIFYIVDRKEFQIELSPGIPFTIQQDLRDAYNQDQLNLLKDVLIHLTDFRYPVKKVD